MAVSKHVQLSGDFLPALDAFQITCQRQRADPLGDESRRILAVLALDGEGFRPAFLVRC